MVHDAVKVVDGFNLESLFDELGVRAEGCYVQVTQREVNKVLKFAPLVAIQAEPL